MLGSSPSRKVIVMVSPVTPSEVAPPLSPEKAMHGGEYGSRVWRSPPSQFDASSTVAPGGGAGAAPGPAPPAAAAPDAPGPLAAVNPGPVTRPSVTAPSAPVLTCPRSGALLGTAATRTASVARIATSGP